MKLSEMVRVLNEVRSNHGDIDIRCGQFRIGGVLILHGTLGPVASIIQRRVGSPIAGPPPYCGRERRKMHRRWDDNGRMP